jgi:hypothetical protein
MFQSIEELKSEGFEGFKSIKDLNENIDVVPKSSGIYLVLNLSKSFPEFLEVGTGGHFKNKNPNKGHAYLHSKWVIDTHVVYIGKAGGKNNASTLRSRLKLYLDFGVGKSVGHYGGRLIWQLKHSPNLVVCWKIIENDPRQFESKPFANINS